jgi:acetyl-CoA C-acetyltransferase
MREVVIVGACRTPIGSFQGELSPLTAPKLGALVVAEAVHRARMEGAQVDEVILGSVLQAGLGQAPARQAALGAGLPQGVPCTTINKVCGSGLKAVMLGVQAISQGDAEVVVAGGMESMSNVPYYLPTARTGMRLGNATAVDGLIHDGLWDAFHDVHMGLAAEQCAREQRITRADQDAYALESFRRARSAQQAGRFQAEIVAALVPQRKGPPSRIDADQGPARSDLAKLPTLPPAFQADGTVTAGNASTLSDGAAAVVLMAREAAEQRGLTPLARVLASAQVAQAPLQFTTAPAAAITRALARAGIAQSRIDLYEINEAFAVVALANSRLLGLDPGQVNVEGGAIALGHPIGASGARVLVTLLHALAARGLARGCASLCIGGGEAVALIVERC